MLITNFSSPLVNVQTILAINKLLFLISKKKFKDRTTQPVQRTYQLVIVTIIDWPNLCMTKL